MEIRTNPRQKMISRMVKDLTGPADPDIIVQADLCDGCGECVTACRGAIANQHAGSEPIPRIKVVSQEEGVFYPLLCHNCEEAPCAAACMTGCRRRTESGFVETDYDRCMGCGMCIMVCPFGAIEPVGKEHKARKCDGCTGEETPACVAACRPGALRKGDALLFSYLSRCRSAARTAWIENPAVSGNGKKNVHLPTGGER